MSPFGRLLAGAALVAALQAAPAAAAPLREPGAFLPPARLLAVDQQGFAIAADAGVAAFARWWNPRLGWYDDRLDNSWNRHMPLARLWSAYPAFEALAARAIAEPTPARVAAVRRFAVGAARYWNPDRGGFAYYRGMRGLRQTYYDDNGWWAIAFVDAYRATGDRSDLVQAGRAFRFIVLDGWDEDAGGIWWETSRRHKTAEPLAAAAYVGAFLYGETHDPFYLSQTRKLLRWAGRHAWNSDARLFARNADDPTTMNYVQGMMIGAYLELCRVLEKRVYCQRAERVGAASLRVFPPGRDWIPAADATYLRFLLDLYRYDGNPTLYAAAYDAARRARTFGRGRSGLYIRRWDGRIGAGSFRDHAATVALFAWLAAAPVPAA